jgi:hypothetical protein
VRGRQVAALEKRTAAMEQLAQERAAAQAAVQRLEPELAASAAALAAARSQVPYPTLTLNGCHALPPWRARTRPQRRRDVSLSLSALSLLLRVPGLGHLLRLPMPAARGVRALAIVEQSLGRRG